MAPTVAPPKQDRVRVRRWQATDTDLETVVGKLRELEFELSHDDADPQGHPQPRNCVLNLVVALDDEHRATACDRIVASLAASHPLRAILVHLDSPHEIRTPGYPLAGGAPRFRGDPEDPGHGKDKSTLDAEVTSEAHQLISACPVQREQVLLHVRGEAALHLSSFVEPLLVPDVPTYFWWSDRHRLDKAIVQDAIGFSDVLVVDSARFEHPADGLLQLAALVARVPEPPEGAWVKPNASIGMADLRWDRVRPWRDAIAQFFGPHDRRALLAGLQEVTIESAGAGPDARVGAALLAGWAAWALHSRFTRAVARGEDATEALAEWDGHTVSVTLSSAAHDRLHHGELLAVRLAGRSGKRTYVLTINRDPDGDKHAHVVIELDGRGPLHQRLTLPRMGDPDLILHILWGSQHDPVFKGALLAARPLLEAML